MEAGGVNGVRLMRDERGGRVSVELVGEDEGWDGGLRTTASRERDIPFIPPVAFLTSTPTPTPSSQSLAPTSNPSSPL